MPLTKLDLANLMLAKIKKDHPLDAYLKVKTNITTEPGDITIANLIYHLDQYYDEATTVKSALLFLTEDVGIRKEQCILIVCVPDDELYGKVVKAISHYGEEFLIARAIDFSDAKTLANYFNLGHLSCGLVTSFEVNGEQCYGLVDDVALLALPILVIGSEITLVRYIKLLHHGVGCIINKDDSPTLQNNLKNGIMEMFLT